MSGLSYCARHRTQLQRALLEKYQKHISDERYRRNESSEVCFLNPTLWPPEASDGPEIDPHKSGRNTATAAVFKKAILRG